ncbi:MAG TPA: outer membrane beta-barrel protein, partial [Flavobacterium sp.]|uniref:outer membrane beta-barrel protein n=1 Tax=Flavobacterium sp. TaxID=239 RepID=UPI002CA72F14
TNQKTRNTIFYENNNTSLNITQSLISLKNVQTTSINLGLPIPFGIITEGTAFLQKRNAIDQNAISYLFADLSYNKTKFNNDLYTDFEKGTFMLYLYSQIILKDEYKMFVNYNFTSKGSTDIYNLNEPIQNLDVNFSAKYLDKKLRVLFGVQNILNTSGFNANFNGLNLSSSYNRINETRMARITLTYTFGNFKPIADEDFSKKEQNLIKPVN